MYRRFLGVVALAAVAAPAYASPLELFGFGGRSPALAATGAASCDGYDSVYLNPAGLSEAQGKRLSAGTLFVSFSLDGVDRPVDDAVGIEIGGAIALPLGGWLRDRIGLGLGLYVPTRDLNRARAPRPGTPFYAVLENRSQVVGVQLGLGLRLSERWSVGAGILALATLKGHIAVLATAGGRLATSSEEQIIVGYAPVVGARFRATDTVALAVTAHFASQSPYDIVISNQLGEVLPITLPELRIAGVAQYDPFIAVAEAAWRPRPALLLVAGVAYERWSGFPAPTESVLASAAPQPAPGFHDTLVPRLAAEVLLPEGFVLRSGYELVPAPAPDGSPFIDDTRHVLSLGVGLALAPVHIDAFGQAHFLVGRVDAGVASGGTILVGGMMFGVDL